MWLYHTVVAILVYIWGYSLEKHLKTTHTHTQKEESVSEKTNKQKLDFKFYRRFQFAQSKLGFSLDLATDHFAGGSR